MSKKYEHSMPSKEPLSWLNPTYSLSPRCANPEKPVLGLLGYMMRTPKPARRYRWKFSRRTSVSSKQHPNSLNHNTKKKIIPLIKKIRDDPHLMMWCLDLNLGAFFGSRLAGLVHLEVQAYARFGSYQITSDNSTLEVQYACSCQRHIRRTR